MEEHSNASDGGERLALSVAEAARAIGVSKRHLQDMLHEIPHFRLGGRVLIPVKPFEEWMRERAEREGNRVGEVVDEVMTSFNGEDEDGE
jgi:excisionase family DNA binding protein